ncbi:hypothetical protein [Sutterella wadsworthensis]|uniref:hypothetical protein n=1 Tax=Sutterella wadsworthensis TaxID=40545 RepID=UPI00402A7D48
MSSSMRPAAVSLAFAGMVSRLIGPKPERDHRAHGAETLNTQTPWRPCAKPTIFALGVSGNTAWKTSESDSKKMNTTCSKTDAVGAKACTLVKFSDARAVGESKPELPAAGSNVSCHEAADPKGLPSS